MGTKVIQYSDQMSETGNTVAMTVLSCSDCNTAIEEYTAINCLNLNKFLPIFRIPQARLPILNIKYSVDIFLRCSVIFLVLRPKYSAWTMSIQFLGSAPSVTRPSVAVVLTDKWVLVLTHWGRDKMEAISQTTFSSNVSWMKIMNFD